MSQHDEHSHKTHRDHNPTHPNTPHFTPSHGNGAHFDLAGAALDEMHAAGFKPEFGSWRDDDKDVGRVCDYVRQHT